MHVIGDAPPLFAVVARIGHQPTRLHVFAPGIHRRQTAFLDQLDDQLTVRDKVASGAHEDPVRPLLCDFSEHPLILGRRQLLQQHRDHRHFQSSAYFPKLLEIFWHLSVRRAYVQEPHLGCRRDTFLEDLQALSPDFDVDLDADPGDVAARARQARRESLPYRLDPCPNDRYCARGGADRQCDGVGEDDDHIRIAAGDLVSEIGIALGPPLAGISLDGEVLSLNIPQPPQLPEHRLPEGMSRFADESDRTCRDDNRNPVLLRPLLRARRSSSGREQQSGSEIAPPHSITSSATASSAGGMVRPSALAAFRLIRNSNLVG